VGWWSLISDVVTAISGRPAAPGGSLARLDAPIASALSIVVATSVEFFSQHAGLHWPSGHDPAIHIHTRGRLRRPVLAASCDGQPLG
jgi:hypothetical protein